MVTLPFSRRSLAAGVAACGVSTVLAACGGESFATSGSGEAAAVLDDLAAILGRHGFAGTPLEQVIDTLDQDERPRPLALKAEISSTSVVLTDSKGEVTAPLAGTHHYLAIAPFEARTHECHDHDAGSCTGEMPDQPLHVTIVDAKARTLVDTDAVTYSNGFIGFWVPRNLKGTVSITCDGKRGQAPFSSDAKGATCLTNLQVN